MCFTGLNLFWLDPLLMTSDKKRRLANAVGFLSGVLACLNALRDVRILWPPDVVWEGLLSSQHLEMGAGIALIAVTLVTSALQRRTAAGR
jgi:hypothetical protein